MKKRNRLSHSFNGSRGGAAAFLLLCLGISSSAPGQIADIQVSPVDLEAGETISVSCKIDPTTFSFVMIYLSSKPTVFRTVVNKDRLDVEDGKFLFNADLKTEVRGEQARPGECAVFMRLLDSQKNSILQKKLATIRVREKRTEE